MFVRIYPELERFNNVCKSPISHNIKLATCRVCGRRVSGKERE